MAENNAGNIGEDLKIVTKRRSCSDGDDKNDGIVSTSHSHSQFKRSSVDHDTSPSKPNDEVDLKSDTKGQTSSGDTVIDDSTPPTDTRDLLKRLIQIMSLDKIDDRIREGFDYLNQWTGMQSDVRDLLKRLIENVREVPPRILRDHRESLDFFNQTERMLSALLDYLNLWAEMRREEPESVWIQIIRFQSEASDFQLNGLIKMLRELNDLWRRMRRIESSLEIDDERSLSSTKDVLAQAMSIVMEMGKSPIREDESLTPNEIKILMKETITKLDNWSDLSWAIHGGGSNYSKGEEIKTLSDYDYLLFPTNVSCRIEQCLEHPCYCRVFVTNRHMLPPGFQELLDENDELYPSKFKDFVFSLFSQILKQKPQLERVKNKCTSPAFTIRQVCDSKMQNEIDWVPALQIPKPPDFCMQWKTRMLTDSEKDFPPISVVPKTFPGNDSLWRISFSHFEKEMLGKCTELERDVLQYLKSQLKELKESENTKKKEDWKLSSYPITINCLHFFERHPAKKDENFPSYLQRVRNYLIEALERKNIPHFFIKNFNLLEEVDDEDCRLFIEKLRRQ